MYDEFGNLKKKFRAKTQQAEAAQVLPGAGRAGWEVEELGMASVLLEKLFCTIYIFSLGVFWKEHPLEFTIWSWLNGSGVCHFEPFLLVHVFLFGSSQGDTCFVCTVSPVGGLVPEKELQ